MTLPPPSDHFAGKGVLEHLVAARTKGVMASREVHGAEAPGHLAAIADSGSDTAFAFLILWAILVQTPFALKEQLLIMALFACGWVIWKSARSAKIGWARLERLHRLIEEERWEIEHHRAQEKEELKELYQAKGFQGKLLDEVVEVLMADDERLLRVMLEEELGLTLETFEHPLKQAAGAFIGSIVASIILLIAFWSHTWIGIPLFGLLIIAACAIGTAKLERNRALHAVIWHLSIALLTGGVVYELTQLLFPG